MRLHFYRMFQESQESWIVVEYDQPFSLVLIFHTNPTPLFAIVSVKFCFHCFVSNLCRPNPVLFLHSLRHLARLSLACGLNSESETCSRFFPLQIFWLQIYTNKKEVDLEIVETKHPDSQIHHKSQFCLESLWCLVFVLKQNPTTKCASTAKMTCSSYLHVFVFLKKGAKRQEEKNKQTLLSRFFHYLVILHFLLRLDI